jgi:hypothetical protein
MIAISLRARRAGGRWTVAFLWRLALATCASCASFAACGGPFVLTVTNADGDARSYSIESLAALPTVTVRTGNDHQEPAEYSGVALHELLMASGVAQGKELRGHHLREFVAVTGLDGYQVVFSLAELDPAFAQRTIFLAFRKDGQPLPDKEAPLRVIIPDEQHPTRWIRQVTSIRVGVAPDIP